MSARGADVEGSRAGFYILGDMLTGSDDVSTAGDCSGSNGTDTRATHTWWAPWAPRTCSGIIVVVVVVSNSPAVASSANRWPFPARHSNSVSSPPSSDCQINHTFITDILYVMSELIRNLSEHCTNGEFHTGLLIMKLTVLRKKPWSIICTRLDI